MCTFKFIVSIDSYLHTLNVAVFVNFRWAKVNFVLHREWSNYIKMGKCKFRFHDSFYLFWFGSISTRFDIGFLWFYFITFRFVSTRTFSLCCILFCFFLIKRILLNFALKNKNKPRYTYKKFVFFLLFTRFWPYRLKQIAFVRLHILLANINWNAEVN